MGSSLCQVQFHRSLLTSKRVELTMGSYLLVLMVAGLASAHEYFPEKCPEFEPMQGFDWDQFSNGVWYVTQKFATRSTCLTYEFTTDELGFKEITQLRQLPYSEKVGLDHEYKYTGKLYAANEALPAKMNVRFPINQEGCEHGREKAWTIDPEKVIGGGVGSSVREAVDQIANEFEFKTADQIKEEAEAALI